MHRLAMRPPCSARVPDMARSDENSGLCFDRFAVGLQFVICLSNSAGSLLKFPGIDQLGVLPYLAGAVQMQVSEAASIMERTAVPRPQGAQEHSAVHCR